MTTRANALPLLAASIALISSAGCSHIIKPAYYELRGAKGTIYWVEEPPVSSLDEFRSVYFEPLSTTLGARLCPPELLEEYNRTARVYEAKLENYPGGSPTLSVGGDVVYFQNKGLLSAALLLMRFKLTADGRQVGDGVLRVESKSFREGDIGDLAETAVETLSKYLDEEKMPRDDDPERRRARRPFGWFNKLTRAPG